jgi:spore germination cell wall hydrolase CwlJ-like protein
MSAILTVIQDVAFLALVLWREARGEPSEGKTAVAFSIMNRVRRPSWWGDTVLAVLFKKWQYSSVTDPKDSQLTKWPSDRDLQWQECLEIAHDVYMNMVANPAPGADSYYADSIPPPKWADPKKFVVKIGHHSFYDINSDHERAT